MTDGTFDKLVVNNNVGIGTTEPAAQLHISANEGISSKVFVESINSSLLKVTAESNGASIGTENAFPLSISTNGLPRIQISSDGNVGIGNAPIFEAKLTVNGTVKATEFVGDGSRLNGKVNTSGDTMTGALTVQSNLFVSGNVGIGTDKPTLKLEVVGNIKTTGVISGASLPPNLIRNSYMNILDGTQPAGYSVIGNVTLEAVHPFTKGFEGPYLPEKPTNAASSVDSATQTNPYWFSVWYKGSRASRGGLADGWHSIPDGRILKITGDNSGVHTSVFFPFESNVLTNKVHFKAWLKIASGSKVGFGVDSGYQNVVQGLIITKEQTDAAPDGWYQIDAVIDISEVTSLDGLAFSMGIEASGKFEVYLALPYLANLDNDTWLPSVSDMLSRDGLTVHPSSGNVGIGTTNPSFGLDVTGNNGWIGSADSSQSLGGWRLGRWPDYPPNEWVYLARADSTRYQDLAVGALWAGGALRFGSADDVAEMTPVKAEDNLEPGDVVVIENPSDNRVLLIRSNQPYDFKVAGVISDPSTAGLIIGGSHPTDVNRDDLKPLALAGRVLTKVTTENGSINAGDFLTTSSTSGHAMKATEPGYTLGKALQSFTGDQNGKTKDKIWVLVNLGWLGTKI